MPNLVNPHILLYIRGLNNGAIPQEQELRRGVDLGSYTVGKLDDLLDALETRIAAWVENNPPEG